MSRINPEVFQIALLSWYDQFRRHLPWRSSPGTTPDPYHVWLSEIMLQQTTVKTVEAYFIDFIHRWPRITDLAAAELDEVLSAWAGLGYYARARNLHKCARTIVENYNGSFPTTQSELETLPGIGSYTSAAIAAIAFDQWAPVMDGNIERVMARLFAVEEPLPASKPILKAHVTDLTPHQRPGDFAQALMDLGAMVCTPKQARCGNCPVAQHCRLAERDDAAQFPRKTAKKKKPTRYGIHFWLESMDGHVLLQKRPEQGLLGRMLEPPGTEWTDTRPNLVVPENWEACGTIKHTFTHFHLEVDVYRLKLTEMVGELSTHPSALKGIASRTGLPGVAESDDRNGSTDRSWMPLDRLGDSALPTIMRKVASAALGKPVPTGRRRQTRT